MSKRTMSIAPLLVLVAPALMGMHMCGDPVPIGHDDMDAGAPCTGTAPNCFGNDATHCCGNDPAGPATCVDGAWMCGSAPAPGCNGTNCLAEDAGTTCTGTAPLCFGNDVTQCCGSDPAGSATCVGGAWMCGSAPVPGCNGRNCLPEDAGTTCAGTAPLCFGADVTQCCGNDPAGSASCVGGAWMCGSAPAPGCNGTSCLAPCTGTAPNCFGNDATACCGRDPSGPAMCVAGMWMCGPAPAPGCNGTSCVP